MQIQQEGQDLVIRISLQEAQSRGLGAGDEVEVIKAHTLTAEKFQQLLAEVLREHAGTIEYLKDK